MSQKTLQSFFKKEPKRAREDDAPSSSTPKSVSAVASAAPLADVRKRMESTFKAEKAHKVAKAERAPGESLGLKFDFAEPENLRDAQGRRTDDPEYDARCTLAKRTFVLRFLIVFFFALFFFTRTVFVPQEQYLKMTPFERQFWDVKRKLFDTVVFFRKGMFYELFEGDARLAQREFGMTFTLRASMVMVGFPATQFEQRASVLLAKGYRVARVDQAESAIGAEKRLKAGGRELEEKVIKRTVTEILTPGTLQDPQILGDSSAAPRFISVWEGENRVLGVCVVECATHTLWIGSFKDDAKLGHLETLLLQTVPREAVACRGACSPLALALLRGRVLGGRSLVQVREPGNDFWEPERARRVLEGAFDTTRVPRLVQVATAGTGDQALLWAVGGALSYLEEIGVLNAVLSASVKIEPFDALPVGQVALDGSTLVNLEILEGPTSLLRLLDHTVSTQGARLFRQWVCAPLVDAGKISDRLHAVEVLRSGTNPDWAKGLRVELRHIPDLERLAAVCAVGVCTVPKLATLVLGMQRAWNALVSRFRCNAALRTASTNKSLEYVGESLALEEAAALNASVGVELEELLRLTPNWSAVKESGVLEPSVGADEEADKIRFEIENVQGALNSALKRAREDLSTHDVVFVDIGKTRNLLDAPNSVRERALQKGYRLINSTKARDRFASKQTEQLVERLLELEDSMQTHNRLFLGSVQRRVVVASEAISELNRAVAGVDCLLSLAAFVDAHPGELCRPIVLARGGSASFFEAAEFRHPISLQQSSSLHIANTVMLGGPEPSLLLVTGPNMAGKSTLLRSVCLLAIMAQIGVWVPAQSCR